MVKPALKVVESGEVEQGDLHFCFVCHHRITTGATCGNFRCKAELPKKILELTKRCDRLDAKVKKKKHELTEMREKYRHVEERDETLRTAIDEISHAGLVLAEVLPVFLREEAIAKHPDVARITIYLDSLESEIRKHEELLSE